MDAFSFRMVSVSNRELTLQGRFFHLNAEFSIKAE